MQKWDPFSPDPVELTPMNFNFQPRVVGRLLRETGFQLKRQITVSHFRLNVFKYLIPPGILASMDALAGTTGNLFQLTPSIFTLSITDTTANKKDTGFFQCPECSSPELITQTSPDGDFLLCNGCQCRWGIRDGIYDFREPIPC